MVETLGSLCDKLTIVKLKQWHTNQEAKLSSLVGQEIQLQEEIDTYVSNAVAGRIASDRLTFASNKVLKGEASQVPLAQGTIGGVFAELSRVNCELWHEQEKVYEFETVPDDQRVSVVKRLGVLNIERTRCIDAIDAQLLELLDRKEQLV